MSPRHSVWNEKESKDESRVFEKSLNLQINYHGAVTFFCTGFYYIERCEIARALTLL